MLITTPARNPPAPTWLRQRHAGDRRVAERSLRPIPQIVNPRVAERRFSKAHCGDSPLTAPGTLSPHFGGTTEEGTWASASTCERWNVFIILHGGTSNPRSCMTCRAHVGQYARLHGRALSNGRVFVRVFVRGYGAKREWPDAVRHRDLSGRGLEGRVQVRTIRTCLPRQAIARRRQGWLDRPPRRQVCGPGPPRRNSLARRAVSGGPVVASKTPRMAGVQNSVESETARPRLAAAYRGSASEPDLPGGFLYEEKVKRGARGDKPPAR